MSFQDNTYQFAGNERHPVYVEYIGGEIKSSNISFDDYSRMTTQRHKLRRSSIVPMWAYNDTKLRAVIVGCVIARAYQQAAKRFCYGTDAERLARAQKKIADEHRPKLIARIDKLCAQYMAAKRAGDAELTTLLGQKVEETDTQLRMIDNPAKYYAGAAYHCWRSGLDSVAAGLNLGIKPPHVRCLLWRMGKVAGQLGYGAPKIVQRRPGSKAATQAAVRAARVVVKTTTNRKTLIKAALILDPHKRRQKKNTYLIPYAERLPLVVKMYRAGASSSEIAAALGWRKNSRGCQDGFGMVKRLAIQAGLRTA